MTDPVAELLDRARRAVLPVWSGGATWLRDKRAAEPSPGAPLASLQGVDLVTDGDLLVDRLVTEGLDALHPGVPVISEERPPPPGAEGDCFVLDPVDGTHNFAAGLPQWAISLARLEGGRAVEGWVLEGASGRLYHARRGGGARCEGRVLRVASRPPHLCLLSLGLSHRVVPLLLNSHRFVGTRVLGSHALGLCWTAEGLFGAHAGRGYAWDVAAGRLLIEEAGGIVCAFDGGPSGTWDHDYSLAGAPEVVGLCLELLAAGELER